MTPDMKFKWGEVQFVQANATLSSDFGPNFSDERATMRPPSAR
jgi:hypothetical protein